MGTGYVQIVARSFNCTAAATQHTAARQQITISQRRGPRHTDIGPNRDRTAIAFTGCADVKGCPDSNRRRLRATAPNPVKAAAKVDRTAASRAGCINLRPGLGLNMRAKNLDRTTPPSLGTDVHPATNSNRARATAK